ncbi:MAG: chemotaxis protein CheB [Polyangiaceae bacterium]
MGARELVVIGTSLGGLTALRTLLPALPADLRLAVVIVQHRLAGSGDKLVQLLEVDCALPLSDAEDKQAIELGHVYVAPSDYHLLIDRGSFSLSTEPRVRHARPSIDVLFESAAHAYGPAAIGVILTGASNDGAQGLARIKACGGIAVVQSPETAECATLPLAAIEATSVDGVLTLDEIGALMRQHGKPRLTRRPSGRGKSR